MSGGDGQPVDCTIEEAFKAGKEVGEIAGKIAVDALAEARYQRDRIERAYKQLLSEKKREPSWQPIKTAPRDCSTVLVAYESELRGWTVKEAWWGYAYEGAPPEQCSWRYDGNKVLLDKSIHGLGAAYWMPLPKPPTADIEGDPA
jgi:hypothetical protein